MSPKLRVPLLRDDQIPEPGAQPEEPEPELARLLEWWCKNCKRQRFIWDLGGEHGITVTPEGVERY